MPLPLLQEVHRPPRLLVVERPLRRPPLAGRLLRRLRVAAHLRPHPPGTRRLHRPPLVGRPRRRRPARPATPRQKPFAPVSNWIAPTETSAGGH